MLRKDIDNAKKFVLDPYFISIRGYETQRMALERELQSCKDFIENINSLIYLIKKIIGNKNFDTKSKEVKNITKLESSLQENQLLESRFAGFMEFLKNEKGEKIALEKTKKYDDFKELFESLKNGKINEDILTKLNEFPIILNELENIKKDYLGRKNELSTLVKHLKPDASIYATILKIEQDIFDIRDNKKIRCLPEEEKNNIIQNKINKRIDNLTEKEIKDINKAININLFERTKKLYDTTAKDPLLEIYDIFYIDKSKAQNITDNKTRIKRCASVDARISNKNSIHQDHTVSTDDHLIVNNPENGNIDPGQHHGSELTVSSEWPPAHRIKKIKKNEPNIRSVSEKEEIHYRKKSNPRQYSRNSRNLFFQIQFKPGHCIKIKNHYHQNHHHQKNTY